MKQLFTDVWGILGPILIILILIMFIRFYFLLTKYLKLKIKELEKNNDK